MEKSSPRKEHKRMGAFNISTSEAERHGFSAPKQWPKERYISPNEAGRILNVTGEAIKQWIYHRRLPAVKLSNGYWKVNVKDLESFVAANKQAVRRILIYDHVGNALDEKVRQLTLAGYEMVVAQNSMDVLLKATDLVPALFLLNTSLEGSWELIHKIRQTRHIRRLPILLLSETAIRADYLDRVIKLKIQGIILQPVTNEKLIEEIQKTLGRIM